MVNINFVPEHYVQNHESQRTNLIYLALLAVVMAGLGGSFMTIKMRQRSLNSREQLVNTKLTKAQESIKQFEQLQTRRKTMMKTALTTAELLEPVARSVLLASLTNNLPTGVSLLKLDLIQKEPRKVVKRSASQSKYQSAQGKIAAAPSAKVSPEQLLETNISIEGLAPSDIQVAAYIEWLSSSNLLDNVSLVESKEFKIEEVAFRRFKLTAMLDKAIHLTKNDVDVIRSKAGSGKRVF